MHVIGSIIVVRHSSLGTHVLVRARGLAPNTTIRSDVCVVGAGPAGITIASRLAEAGKRVALLDSGQEPPVDRGRDPDTGGESVGLAYYPLSGTRVRGFGGTSNHWGDNGWFRARPLEASEFATPAGLDLGGWPLDRDDLEPFYRRAHAACELGRYDYDGATHASSDRRELPFVGGDLMTSIFRMSPPDVWTRRFGDIAADERIELILGATVVEIEVSAGQHVQGLRVVGEGGVRLDVRAATYVLATGGIENPRMLLLSRSDEHPTGLGNNHGLVGRFFMEHPQLHAATIEPADPDLPLQTGLYDMHPSGEQGVRIHAKLAVRPEVMRSQGLLTSVFFVHAVSAASAHSAVRSAAALKNARTWRPVPKDLPGHVGRVAAGLPAVAKASLERLKRRRGGGQPRREVLQLTSMAEQAPNPESRVMLGSRRDRFGLPVARLDWRVTDLDRQSLRTAVDIIDDVVRSHGHGRMVWKIGDSRPVEPLKGGWHHMGTTRMDPDPREGVVDANCRVHGVDNLYVTGSSTFSTSGYANPTLTLVAMAFRLADHLADL